MTDRADDEPWYFTDLLADVSAGEWAAAGTGPFDGTVTSLVPRVFETYSRVLHSASMRTEARVDVPVRWSTVAEALGAVVHQSVAWGSMIEAGVRQGQDSGRGTVWTDSPSVGQMSEGELRGLAMILTDVTTTPDECYFGFWEGAGLQCIRGDQPGLELPGRKHLLVHGAVLGASRDLQGIFAHVWWPADRAWFVATDVDLNSTYIGGSTDLANSLASRQDLEGLSRAPTGTRTPDPVSWNPSSDTVRDSSGKAV